MVASSLAALDVPLKVLVWDDAEQTKVTYYAPGAPLLPATISAPTCRRTAPVIDQLTDALTVPEGKVRKKPTMRTPVVTGPEVEERRYAGRLGSRFST